MRSINRGVDVGWTECVAERLGRRDMRSDQLPPAHGAHTRNEGKGECGDRSLIIQVVRQRSELRRGLLLR